MDPQSFHRIERLNYLLGALLIAASVFVGTRAQVLGVVVGVVITCLNFSVIRRLVTRLLQVAPERRGITAFYFVPKMAALMAAVALAIYFLPISPMGLAVGFSIFLVSIAVESVRFMTRHSVS